jgi:hypothetical protein
MIHGARSGCCFSFQKLETSFDFFAESFRAIPFRDILTVFIKLSPIYLIALTCISAINEEQFFLLLYLRVTVLSGAWGGEGSGPQRGAINALSTCHS